MSRVTVLIQREKSNVNKIQSHSEISRENFVQNNNNNKNDNGEDDDDDDDDDDEVL